MLDFEIMAQENLQEMALSLVLARLKKVTEHMVDEGDCPLCGAWVQYVDAAGNEVEGDGFWVALREEHTATCPVGNVREQLKIAIQPIPVKRY